MPRAQRLSTRSRWIGGLLCAACAQSPPSQQVRAPSPRAAASLDSAPASAPSAPPAQAPSGAPATHAAFRCDDASSTGANEASLSYAFSRVHDGPASSLAAAAPKIGVLDSERASVFDGRAWTTLAPIQKPDGAHFELFFGRDFEPRLLGYVDAPSARSDGPHSFYKRFKGGRWQDEPSELGPFANGAGALYGVLGIVDPEVVCRPSAQCLIKRVSGWSRVPAHAAPVRIALAGGTAWALYPNHVERLEPAGFARFGPERSWRDPSGIWVDARGAPWIAEPAERALFRLEQGAWLRVESPLAEPRALWGRANDDLWLVGAGGAAHFDGTTWQCANDVRGPLRFIVALGDELWLAGDAGVFRGQAKRAKAP